MLRGMLSFLIKDIDGPRELGVDDLDDNRCGSEKSAGIMLSELRSE